MLGATSVGMNATTTTRYCVRLQVKANGRWTHAMMLRVEAANREDAGNLAVERAKMHGGTYRAAKIMTEEEWGAGG